MPRANPNPTSRRSLFGVGGATTVLLTSGTGAALGTPAPSDAELVRLCAEFDGLEWRLQALCDEHSNDNTLEDDMRFEAAYELIRGAQEQLLARICACPAATAEGMLAKATTLIYFTSNPIGCNNDSWADRLTISMRRDLTKARRLPAYLAHGPTASPAVSTCTKPVS